VTDRQLIARVVDESTVQDTPGQTPPNPEWVDVWPGVPLRSPAFLVFTFIKRLWMRTGRSFELKRLAARKAVRLTGFRSGLWRPVGFPRLALAGGAAAGGGGIGGFVWHYDCLARMILYEFSSDIAAGAVVSGQVESSRWRSGAKSIR